MRRILLAVVRPCSGPPSSRPPRRCRIAATPSWSRSPTASSAAASSTAWSSARPMGSSARARASRSSRTSPAAPIASSSCYERGGRLPDGTAVWIPGAPQFAPGDEVVLCLERTADGYRTVSMAFSAFRVGARGRGRSSAEAIRRRRRGRRSRCRRRRGVARARRFQAHGGGPSRGVAARALLSRRRRRPRRWPRRRRRPRRRAVHAARRRAALAAGGQRSVDRVVPQHAQARRRCRAPIPTTRFARRSLRGPTPPAASIVLAFGGTRNVAIEDTPGEDPYCTAGNLGVGLITFGDPLDELPVGVLAIGGGCATASTHVVNGTIFNAFTHGLVVLNDDAAIEGYRTVPNITRILEHEVGHAIGLGHTDAGQDNIMYPSCCAAAMPVPPAIGPDDLAGLVFIYPLPAAALRLHLTARHRAVGLRSAATMHRSRSRRRAPTAPGPRALGRAVAGHRRRRSSGSTGSAGTLRCRGAAAPRRARAAIRRGGGRTGVSRRSRRAATPTTTATASPTRWETFFGLDPTSAVGDRRRRAAIRTATASRTRPSRPRARTRAAPFRRYLAEGAANAFFDDADRAVQPRAGQRRRCWSASSRRAASSAAWPIRLDGLRRRTMPSPLLRSARRRRVLDADRVRSADRRRPHDAVGRDRLRRARRDGGRGARRRPGISPKARRRATSSCSTCCRTRRRRARSVDGALPAAARRSRPSRAPTPSAPQLAPDDPGRQRSAPELASTDVSGVDRRRRSRSSSSARCT